MLRGLPCPWTACHHCQLLCHPILCLQEASASHAACIRHCHPNNHERMLHLCASPGSAAAAAAGSKRKREPAVKPSRALGVGGLGSAAAPDQAGAVGDQEHKRLRAAPLEFRPVAASGGCMDHVRPQNPQVGSP